ncbi:Nucleic acid dioxygenase ALKBH1 [Nymphon striatum]|nr:Nucleic acid dioxygenase ALKBH1 [Nymphon striatum]
MSEPLTPLTNPEKACAVERGCELYLKRFGPNTMKRSIQESHADEVVQEKLNRLEKQPQPDVDAFKAEYKRYQYHKKKVCDFSDVKDFNTCKGNQTAEYVDAKTDEEATELDKGYQPAEYVDTKTVEEATELGLIPPNEWEIFSSVMPGVYFIKNPFTADGQMRWIRSCLSDYPVKPNKTNLDRHVNIGTDDNIWDLRKSKELEKRKWLKKLRWTTLGYHHNWNTKVYSMDDYSVFPEELNKLCQFIVSFCGFKTYKAEAAIVNYYHFDSSIGGHTDHSEFDHTAPLISISFGQSAIFLVGGKTKDVKPISMFLHSGDIVIMANESRLSYHAVPRIVKAPVKSWLSEGDENSDDTEIKDCHEYLNQSRININVRQVYKR